MKTKTFEHWLFKLVKAYEATEIGKDDGTYQWIMDTLSINVTDEQWNIVCDTLDMIRDSNFIIQEGGCLIITSPKQKQPPTYNK